MIVRPFIEHAMHDAMANIVTNLLESTQTFEKRLFSILFAIANFNDSGSFLSSILLCCTPIDLKKYQSD
jgi:hypothetical protein